MLLAAMMLSTSCEQIPGLELPNGDDTEQTPDDGNNGEDEGEKPGDKPSQGEDEGDEPNDKPSQGEGEGNEPGEGEGEGTEPGDGTEPGEGEGNEPGNQPGEGENEGEENPNGKPDQPGEGGVSSLTPGQHKQRLEQIGLDFLSYFNAEEHKELIDAMIALSDVWGIAEEVEPQPMQPMPTDRPEEEYTRTRAMMSAIMGIAKGSPAAMVEFATRAADESTILDLNDYGGTIFTFDTKNEEWVEGTGAKGNEIKASWPDNYGATITWSNSSKYWDYQTPEDYYDDYIRVYIPSEINFVITSGSKTLATIDVEPQLTDNYTLAPNAKVTFPGGFVYNIKSSANATGINAQVTFSKGSQLLMSAAATIAINDFTDPDNWYYEDDYVWEDEFGNQYQDRWYDPTMYMIEHAKTGQFQIDLLDLSIVGSGDFRKIYDTAESFDDDEEDGWNSNAWANAMVDVINKEAKCYLFYNDTNEKVCDVVAQKTKWTDEYYDWETDQYVTEDMYAFEPIMLFPDDSKYSFESYFTKKKFNSLIEAFEALVEAYAKLLPEDYVDEDIFEPSR